MKSLFGLAILLCISDGYGLKCYKCVSTKSWDDCADVKEEMTCPSGFDLCIKGHAQIKGEGASVESFEKGCTTAFLCENTAKLDICKGKGRVCEINCCSGDLCNAAALPLVGSIVLIACALVALLH